ncbi:hypothetical protein GQ600_11509 [Phytophthora cactorum]|nr:hypothetical protein GQ600_11509 [Phytophthora cactorum]
MDGAEPPPPDVYEYLQTPYRAVGEDNSYPDLRKEHFGSTPDAVKCGDSPLALFFYFFYFSGLTCIWGATADPPPPPTSSTPLGQDTTSSDGGRWRSVCWDIWYNTFKNGTYIPDNLQGKIRLRQSPASAAEHRPNKRKASE